MSNIPEDLYYTDEHEYLKPDDDNVVVVGITDYAQGELGVSWLLKSRESAANIKRWMRSAQSRLSRPSVSSSAL